MKTSATRNFICAAGVAGLSIAGCGGGGGGTASPVPSATAAPAIATATPKPGSTAAPATATPTPAPGVVTLSQSSVALSGVGSGAATTVTASEGNYSGGFTAANGTPSCAGIATIGGTNPFTVTPVAAGTCNITISDANNISTTLAVTVTTTTVTISATKRTAQ